MDETLLGILALSTLAAIYGTFTYFLIFFRREQPRKIIRWRFALFLFIEFIIMMRVMLWSPLPFIIIIILSLFFREKIWRLLSSATVTTTERLK